MLNKQPKYLYKYLNNKGLIKTIKSLSIRCSQATSFNDPFDCKPPFYFANDCTKKCLSTNKYGSTCEGFVKCVTEKCYVSCFTTQPFNILMWGHYTNNYNGGVIKLKRENFLLKNSKKIIYTKEIPTISSKNCFLNHQNGDEQEIIETLYLRKHPYWKYEKEWRVLSHIYNLQHDLNNIDMRAITDLNIRKKNSRLKRFLKNNKVIIPLHKDDIKEIYLGYKNNKIDVIKKIIKEKNIETKLYVVKPEINSYRLIKEEIFIN